MRTDPIIITGAGHSGTRGLVHILTESGNVYLGDIDHPKKEWEFYRVLAQQVNQRLLNLPAHDHNMIPKEVYWHFFPTRDQIKNLKDYILGEIQANPELSMPPDPTQKWIIKTPRTNLSLEVWQAVFPQAHFINLIRDGRDVAASLPFWDGSLLRRFELWRARVNRMECYRQMGVPITNFRYEDLPNPGLLKKFCAKLEIPYSPKMQEKLMMSLSRGIQLMRGLNYETFELIRYGYPVEPITPWKAFNGRLMRFGSDSRLLWERGVRKFSQK